jgi:HlyD family secretion protein
MKIKILVAAALVVGTGLSVNAVYSRRGEASPEIVTDVVSRGAIVSVVNASGTIETVTTVQVGTQISGTVQALYADFNSIVRKGQIVARLDPSLVQAEIEQARAVLNRAQADEERLKIALADAGTKARRARELAARQLISANDLETAEVTLKSAEAQLRAQRAQVTQARASLSQAQVNLQKTVITAPIDGIVIARNVDVGQTVAASLSAPTLFEIAADLAQMQVKASVDESDLGQIREGQTVTFAVDAYPNDVFKGVVRQVRLNPVVEQNVVTYAAIITAPNPDLKLRPGMTANVTVETARRDNALRVPTAAMRFRPDTDVLAALGSPAAERANQTPSANVNTVWLFDGGLRPVSVRAGVSDGMFTEIVEGSLADGDRVAIRVAPAGASPSRPTSTNNPLMSPTPQRRF